jgi:hypothetical protein
LWVIERITDFQLPTILVIMFELLLGGENMDGCS